MGDLISRTRSTHLKDIRLSSETNAFDKEGCIWPGPRLSNPREQRCEARVGDLGAREEGGRGQGGKGRGIRWKGIRDGDEGGGREKEDEGGRGTRVRETGKTSFDRLN